MMVVVVTTGTIRHAMLQSDRHHQQTNIQFLVQTGCPSCHPQKQCHSHSTEGKQKIKQYVL